MGLTIARVAVLCGALAASGAHPGPAAATDDPVLAVVNGLEIRLSEVLRAKNRLPLQLRDTPDNVVMPVLLNLIIDSRLLADEARKQGLAYEPEVRAQLQFVEDMVLEQVILQRKIAGELTEEAVKARYQQLMADTSARDQVRARHILLEQEVEAVELIKQLDAGADFSVLAEKWSVDSSRKAGGDLGYFSRAEMVPEFADAAFALKVGEHTRTPVRSEFGWHVIKVDDRRMADPPPFERMEPQIRSELGLALRAEYVEELRKKAEIARFDKNIPAADEPPGDGAPPKPKD